MVKNSRCCKVYENHESRGACSRHLSQRVRTSLMRELSYRCGEVVHFQKLWEIILQLKAWSFTVSTGGQCRFIALQLPIIDAILSSSTAAWRATPCWLSPFTRPCTSRLAFSTCLASFLQGSLAPHTTITLISSMAVATVTKMMQGSTAGISLAGSGTTTRNSCAVSYSAWWRSSSP